MFGLGHLDLGPFIYGILMFLGLAVLVVKIAYNMWFSLFIDVGVFWLVFSLHGGTQAGGFAAMIAAMLAGIFFPMMLRR